jgi:predicted AlkP superfamily phosphohydrolase/phosphomutase
LSNDSKKAEDYLKMKPISKTVLIGLDAAVSSLVENYLTEGMMPNLKSLIQRGGYTRARSVFPGVTPINWATIATGAYPGTHGITDFAVLDPHDPLDGGRDGFTSTAYHAETLWQAACREGYHAATLNFPGAEKSQHANHLWIAGRGSPAARTEYAISNTNCFASKPYDAQLRDSIPIELNGLAGTIQLRPMMGEGDGLTLKFKIETGASSGKGVRVFTVDGQEITFLKYQQPSPWLWGEFQVDHKKKNGSYRLELTHFNDRQPAIAIYVSQITCPTDICSKPDMGKKLVSELGPFLGYCGGRGVDRGWCSPQHMVDEGRYKGSWLAKAARQLISTYHYDLVLLKWHLLDHIEHSFWGGMDPASPFFEPKFERIFTSLIKDSYRAADELIGELLPLLDEGVTLVVVGDHGHLPHLKAVSINNLLAQSGLIKLMPGSDDPPEVDWNQTQVYGGPALGHIWINRQGQRPNGIVAESDVEPVCQRVIDLLLNLRDPQNGEQPIEKVFRKEEARKIGLWGDRVGDIVYWMKPGYSGDFNWSPLSRSEDIVVPLNGHNHSQADFGERKFIADKFQSVHGCGDPSASLGMGTEETILAMAGPQIRVGKNLSSIPNLTATAPTLCAASGLPMPNKSEGEILAEWIK